MRSTSRIIGIAAATLFAANAYAFELVALTPEGGLPNTELRHLEMNEAGDYLAVSHTRVFMGNVRTRSFNDVFSAPNSSFVLSGYVTLQGNGTQPNTIRADLQVLGSRVALNGRGDFVLASNTRLYVGNTRANTVTEVANSGAFTSFQQVAINDAGHYAAITDRKIYVGTTDGTPTQVIDEAVGSFETLEMYGFNDRIDSEAGQSRLALNASGQFVAVTRSAIYGGSVPAATADKLFEERRIWFQHVRLAEDGTFVTVTDDDIFTGTL